MSFSSAKGNQFEASIDSIRPERNAINPTLSFSFKFSNKSNAELKINPVFQFRLLNNMYVGNLLFDMPSITLASLGTAIARAKLILTHYGLSQIEKLRENGDLSFKIFCHLDIRDSLANHSSSSSSFEGKIAKSDWVEQHLETYKYKEVVLLEVPKIDFPDFAQAAELLNDAWKKKSMGQFSEVLVDCRKALEFTTDAVKKKGFKTPDGKPDWTKFIGDENIGDINGTIIQKISGFVSGAAHVGKTFNIEDADYALLITYSIVNYVLNKLQRLAL